MQYMASPCGCAGRPLFPPSSPSCGSIPHHSHILGGSTSPFPHPEFAPMGALSRCSACGLWISFAVTATVSPFVGTGQDVAAWQRPCSEAKEALGMCPQQASIPPQQSEVRVTFRLCRGLAATPGEALCQHRAWVSFRKGRGTWLGNGVIPARQLGELGLQSQMVQGRLRGAGTEIQDHLSRCRRTRGCGSTPSRWSLIHGHQQKLWEQWWQHHGAENSAPCCRVQGLIPAAQAD